MLHSSLPTLPLSTSTLKLLRGCGRLRMSRRCRILRRTLANLLRSFQRPLEKQQECSTHSLGFFEKLGYHTIMSSGTPTSSMFVVEVLVGEMTDIMERIRWNCLETRAKPVGDIDPSTFPWTYDGIHMGNVPEYVGGLLTAAMYGRPLLREDTPSQMRFNMCFTTSRFPSREHYLAEYMLMHNEKRIADHFALERHSQPIFADVTPQLMTPEVREAWRRAVGADVMDFGQESFQIWEKGSARQIAWKDRLTRLELEKWLHGHFFKIILPHYRNWVPDLNASEGQQPLNLTAFIRLVCLMSERGYPAHWLSDILRALCGVGPNGEITTTARPPVQPFASPTEVDMVFAPRRMTLAPWKTEFTTLLSIWSRLLPFGFFAPDSLVGPTEVAEYSVTFPAFEPVHLRVPHFILLFWNCKLFETRDLLGLAPEQLLDTPPEYLWSERFQAVSMAPPKDQIERMLRDDERGADEPIPTRIRREGVHVFTAMKFVTHTPTASFWCSRDVMEKMREGEGWKVYIYRTDTWDAVTVPAAQGGVKVKDGVTEVRRWTE
ncbi:hypothetical protein GE09DRAFT_15274 [Coniochaeta sp. 2T2.1]|nr:hypothetical protein GE09DRAFT_15274 [Coniochaeta sp. 2T2.1]